MSRLCPPFSVRLFVVDTYTHASVYRLMILFSVVITHNDDDPTL